MCSSRSISISDKILRGIAEAAQCVGARRVVLFGSRARGDASPVSDIDLAVVGADAAEFLEALDERADTLLRFDAVRLDAPLMLELASEIERDGVVVYDK